MATPRLCHILWEPQLTLSWMCLRPILSKEQEYHAASLFWINLCFFLGCSAGVGDTGCISSASASTSPHSLLKHRMSLSEHSLVLHLLITHYCEHFDEQLINAFKHFLADFRTSLTLQEYPPIKLFSTIFSM